MTLKRAALSFFALALIPASIAAYYVHRDYTSTQRENTPTGHLQGGATLGDDHFNVLSKITKAFVASNASSVTPAMRAGTELAPLPVLNSGLEEQGLKWRVREVHGLVAQTFDVV